MNGRKTGRKKKKKAKKINKTKIRRNKIFIICNYIEMQKILPKVLMDKFLPRVNRPDNILL